MCALLLLPSGTVVCVACEFESCLARAEGRDTRGGIGRAVAEGPKAGTPEGGAVKTDRDGARPHPATQVS